MSGYRGGTPSARVFHPPNGVPPVNAAVKASEDAYPGKNSQSLEGTPSAPTDEQNMPTRPAFGTCGKPVFLFANYFPVEFPKELTIYRYQINVLGIDKMHDKAHAKYPNKQPDEQPDEQPDNQGDKQADKQSDKQQGGLRRRLIDLLIKQNLADEKPFIATDFAEVLVSTKELKAEKYPVKIEGKEAYQDKTYHVALTASACLSASKFLDYVQSSHVGEEPNLPAELLQAVNIIINFHLRNRCDVVYKSASNTSFQVTSTDCCNLGSGLKAIRGYCTSVRTATQRMLLNVQVSHIAVRPYEAVNLRTMIKTFRGEPPLPLDKLEAFLRGFRVEKLHLKRGSHCPRGLIRGLATQGDGRDLDHPPRVSQFGANAKGVQFWQEDKSGQSDGQYTTVHDYFWKEYKIDLKDDCPVVNVGTHTEPTYLPPDVCCVFAGQEVRSLLLPRQAGEMIKFAVRRPDQNLTSITMNGLAQIGATTALNNVTLQSFGLRIHNSPVVVPGRMLRSPLVFYGHTQPRITSASWNLKDATFTKPSVAPQWACVWIRRDPYPTDSERLEGSTLRPMLERFQDTWKDSAGFKPKELKEAVAARPVFLQRPGATRFIAPSKTIAENKDRVEKVFKQLMAQFPDLRLVLVILPDEDTPTYNHVKIAGDVKAGVHTVCVIAKKFMAKEPEVWNNNAQYLANVAMKCNLKLGGRNHHLLPAALGIVGDGKTMVVGLDVTHPSPGSSEKAPSIAAIVASVDCTLGQFAADIRLNTGRSEMIESLKDMVKSRLKLWQHRNNSLPDNILIYRDGVSEGQYDIVRVKELRLIRQACRELYPAPSQTKISRPSISIIVVGKRHKTRFYPTSASKDHTDPKTSHPLPGTTVDRGITSLRTWDFFMQAHGVLHGTAKPAHYVVILDEIFTNPANKTCIKAPRQSAADSLEHLTHSMCYLFQRATKAVSIAPPAYYADLACDRARRWLGAIMEMESNASTDGGEHPVIPDEVTVHPRLRDSMFYI